MTLAMTQPAPEFPEADVLSLEVDLAEVTAEMPALVRLDEVREARAVPPSSTEPASDTYTGLLRQAVQVLRANVAADEMLRALFQDVRELVGVDAYFNFMVNEAGDALALASFSGVSEEVAGTFERIEFGQAVCGSVALKRAPIVVANIQSSNDRRVQLVKSFGIRAVACNPLLAGERLLGTLSFASRTRDQFGAEDLEFFSAIARAVALSHERMRLARELAVVEGQLEAMGQVTLSSPTPVATDSADPMLTATASDSVRENAPVALSEELTVEVAALAPSEAAAEVMAADVAPDTGFELTPEVAAPIAVELAPVSTLEDSSVVTADAALIEATVAMPALNLAEIELLAPLEASSAVTADAAPVVEPTLMMPALSMEDFAPEAAVEAAPIAEATSFELMQAAPAAAEVTPFAPAEEVASPVAADVPSWAPNDAPAMEADVAAEITLIEVSAMPVATEVAGLAPVDAPAAAEVAPFALAEEVAADVPALAPNDAPAMAAEVAAFAPTEVTVPAAESTPFELIEASPVGADVIPFRRPWGAAQAVMTDAVVTEEAMLTEDAVLTEDIPLGLIEAAPVSALEVSPLAPLEIATFEPPYAEQAPDHDPLTSPSADATGVVTLTNDIEVTADLEAPPKELLALALAAADAPTIEVMALALTIDDPLHHAAAKLSAAVHESGIFAATQDSDILGTPRESSSLLEATHEAEILRATLESEPALALTHESPANLDATQEITVELFALDVSVAPAPTSAETSEVPDLDLSAEISALDLRPVEVAIEPLPAAKPAHRKPSRPTPHARDVVLDDNTPTVEVKPLALQELEAERAPAEAGDDITFTYVPPAVPRKK